MSAITHRAAVARLKFMEAELRNLVKAITEGRHIDALVQMTLDEAAMLISCLEAPDPVTANVHYQSARAAAEAAAYDAFQRGGAEPPQSQPVTREEFDRVASRVTDVLTMAEATRAVIDEDKGRFDQLEATVGDIANTLGRERVVERLSQLEVLDKRIDALRARLDGQRIAGDDLASRVAALEKLTDLETWRELADAHSVAARALHARVRKLGSGTGGAS